MDPPTPNAQPAEPLRELQPPLLKPTMLARVGIGGVLMGLANLVPGVSGGTMVLVVGLYDEVVSSVAELTRLKFTRRNVLLVGGISVISLLCIVNLSGPVLAVVTAYPGPMYALFIGLTLGGVPLLRRMIGPFSAGAVIMMILGVLLMVGIALSRTAKPDRAAVRADVEQGQFVIEPRYGVDLFGGALAAAAMVLPGISGSYMLLILERYETVLASISTTKAYVLPGGPAGDIAGLHVLVPLAIGTALGLITIANLLQWLLRHHARPTLGLLLGILLGSVVGLWRYDRASSAGDYAGGLALAAAGFAATYLLSRLSASPSKSADA